jgi:hypothetical protein
MMSCSSIPGYQLPTASSRARSLATPNKSSMYHLSTVSTPAQVDRVHKAKLLGSSNSSLTVSFHQ